MKHINNLGRWTMCGLSADTLLAEDIVVAALESDCNECRAKQMVQPVEWSRPKTEDEVSVPINITKHPQYKPTPLSDADAMIAAAIAKRDGR